MSGRIALLIAFLTGVLVQTALADTKLPASSDQVVFEQLERGVSVQYKVVDSNTVEFTSSLPDSWGFVVSIDGDQDGRWGEGIGAPKTPRRKTNDREFSHTKAGKFCPGYVLTSQPDNPHAIFASSVCGAIPSKGVAEVSKPDSAGRILIKLKIPADEIFDEKGTAHIQVCVWSAKAQSCQGSPQEPIKLTRAVSESAQ